MDGCVWMGVCGWVCVHVYVVVALLYSQSQLDCRKQSAPYSVD